MKRRLLRLVCRIRGHREVKVIEEVRMTSVNPLGFTTMRYHIECRRCDTVLQGSKGGFAA